MRININEEEVRHILKMHSKEREKTIKKIISEAGPYEDEEIPVSNTATNATFVSNRDMQKWLNTNKQSGVNTDNRVGPKTIDAINKALGITTQQTTTALEPVKNETSTSGEVGTQI